MNFIAERKLAILSLSNFISTTHNFCQTKDILAAKVLTWEGHFNYWLPNPLNLHKSTNGVTTWYTVLCIEGSANLLLRFCVWFSLECLPSSTFNCAKTRKILNIPRKSNIISRLIYSFLLFKITVPQLVARYTKNKPYN